MGGYEKIGNRPHIATTNHFIKYQFQLNLAVCFVFSNLSLKILQINFNLASVQTMEIII